MLYNILYVAITSLFISFSFLFFFPSPVFASSIVLNEFIPNPISGNDWIELYNPGTQAEDISAWKIRDETSDVETLPPNSIISPNEFFVIDVGNRLNKEKDTISMYSLDNTLIDSQPYKKNPGDGYSLGRYPDGGSWITLQNPTKGTSNQTGTPLPSPTPTTPAPTDTPVPTKTPSPTKTPTPTSVPNPTKTPTPQASVPTIALTATPTFPRQSAPSPTKKPTPAVLGEETTEPEINLETINAAAQATPEPTVVSGVPRENEEGENRGSILPVVLIIVGGILTLGFGTPLAIQEIRSRRKSV